MFDLINCVNNIINHQATPIIGSLVSFMMDPRSSLDEGDKDVESVPLVSDDDESHAAKPVSRPRFSQATIKATFMAVATLLILAALNIHDLAFFGSISFPGFSKG